MDALELLMTDHENVSRLFTQIRSERGISPVIDRVRRELEAHAHAEETVFYPALRKYPECVSIIDRSLDEHKRVAEMLETISRTHQGDPRNFRTEVDELMTLVEKHVKEEEGELFPIVRRLLKRPERETLGRHLFAAKQAFQAEQSAAA